MVAYDPKLDVFLPFGTLKSSAKGISRSKLNLRFLNINHKSQMRVSTHTRLTLVVSLQLLDSGIAYVRSNVP